MARVEAPNKQQPQDEAVHQPNRVRPGNTNKRILNWGLWKKNQQPETLRVFKIIETEKSRTETRKNGSRPSADVSMPF